MTDTSDAPSARPLRVEPFQNILAWEEDRPRQEFRFRILAANGETIAQSEGYTTASARDETIDLILGSTFVLEGAVPDAESGPVDETIDGMPEEDDVLDGGGPDDD